MSSLSAKLSKSKLKSMGGFITILQFLNYKHHLLPICRSISKDGEEFYQRYILQSDEFKEKLDQNILQKGLININFKRKRQTLQILLSKELLIQDKLVNLGNINEHTIEITIRLLEKYGGKLKINEIQFNRTCNLSHISEKVMKLFKVAKRFHSVKATISQSFQIQNKLDKSLKKGLWIGHSLRLDKHFDERFSANKKLISFGIQQFSIHLTEQNHAIVSQFFGNSPTILPRLRSIELEFSPSFFYRTQLEVSLFPILYFIESSKTIRKVKLNNFQLYNDEVAYFCKEMLANNTNINQLSLFYCKGFDNMNLCLPFLQGLIDQRLIGFKRIKIQSTYFGLACIELLQALLQSYEEIGELQLCQCNLTNSNFEQFQSPTNVKVRKMLIKNTISYDYYGYNYLQRVSDLEYIQLYKVNCQSLSLQQAVIASKNLLKLELRQLLSMSPDTLYLVLQALQNCRYLHTLKLENCYITDQSYLRGLSYLKDCKHLKHISLAQMGIDDILSLINLVKVKSLKNKIRIINISQNLISQNHISSLLRTLEEHQYESLVSIDFSGNCGSSKILNSHNEDQTIYTLQILSYSYFPKLKKIGLTLLTLTQKVIDQLPAMIRNLVLLECIHLNLQGQSDTKLEIKFDETMLELGKVNTLKEIKITGDFPYDQLLQAMSKQRTSNKDSFKNLKTIDLDKSKIKLVNIRKYFGTIQRYFK